jgi:hypothetical protein
VDNLPPPLVRRLSRAVAWVWQRGVCGAEPLGLYALAYKLGYAPNYLVLGPFLLIWYPFVFAVTDRERQRAWDRALAGGRGGACSVAAALGHHDRAADLAAVARAGRPGWPLITQGGEEQWVS